MLIGAYPAHPFILGYHSEFLKYLMTRRFRFYFYLCTVFGLLHAPVEIPAQISGGAESAQGSAPVIPSGAPNGGIDPSTLVMPQTSASYKLGVTDLISISVYQEPDLSISTRISDDGTVVLPLLGSVTLGGKSVKEATELVTALYKADYLVSPIVNISVLELTKARFSIMGQVTRPGIYELPAEGTISFVEAIAMAGGYTRVASKSKITVKRLTGGREQVFKVNGKDQEAGNSKLTFRIQGGDVINVGESWF
jgi:polysaccharide export outer membrane protein